MFQFFAVDKSPHVSLPAEEVFSLFGLPITNAWVTGIFGCGLLLWMFFYVARKVKREEKNLFVSIVQWIFETLYNSVLEVIEDEKTAKKVAPLAITIFFFILINYWVGILPVVGPVAIDGIPLFRSLAADLNTTFALAIISMAMVQVYAIKKHGMFGNLGRYFRNPFKDVVGAFEGVLELIAEFSRFVGLSLRLFGNVFAGEILLMMIAFLTSYASTILLPPFYIFELFIGAVQAYIFFMLTIVFIALGLATHDHDDAHSPSTLKQQAAAGGNES